MTQSKKRLFTAIGFTFFMLTVGYLWGQYIACLLGVLVGFLRIYWFWVSGEGKSFERHEIKKPRQQRTPQVQESLEMEYEVYEQENQKGQFWRKRRGFIFLVCGALLVIYLDKNMIFYSFFMCMLVTWMWFQWWLAWKIGK